MLLEKLSVCDYYTDTDIGGFDDDGKHNDSGKKPSPKKLTSKDEKIEIDIYIKTPPKIKLHGKFNALPYMGEDWKYNGKTLTTILTKNTLNNILALIKQL